MESIIVSIIFGWPGAIASFLVSLTGLLTKRYWLLLIGAILLAPPAYYLSGAPGSHRLPMLIVLFPLISAFAIYRKKLTIAWLMIAPAFLVIAYFIFLFIYVQLMDV
jgi:hypothetical protein